MKASGMSSKTIMLLWCLTFVVTGLGAVAGAGIDANNKCTCLLPLPSPKKVRSVPLFVSSLTHLVFPAGSDYPG
jgi:hypothetical protein